MRVLSLFSGIGAPEKALKNIGVPFELVGYCEIDKYASKSYSAIHDVSESMNLGDITKIKEKDLPKDIDLITYGFPCQDISIAGKQKGLLNEDGTQTRSGLFFEALRIIEETQPKIAIAENVKNLVGKKFNAQFQVVLASLEAAGYNNYWKVLNAKDYGIPQNRERVFIVSIRKDIDTGSFEFPQPLPLKLRLKDMLDEKVDEKFYLSNVQIEKLFMNSNTALVYDRSMIGFEGSAREYNDIMPTLTSREWKEPRVVNENRLAEINMLGLLDIKGNEQVRRVYGTDGISPTLNTAQGGNRQPKILTDCTSVAMRGRYNEEGKVEQRLEASGRVVANAITTVQKDSMVTDNMRIRKLTPKECFRLMGFTDEDFAKAEATNSDTQLYKQAGNSIVVDVVAHILINLRSVSE